VRLETNYRSTQPILDAANAVIRTTRAPREAAALGARRRRARARQAREGRDGEAQQVVAEMRHLLRLEEARPADFAVLCRTQVQFRPFEASCARNGLPYVVVGGMSFFDRKEVRDVVAFLKLALHPEDETALLRVINTPARGVGKASLDRVLAFATERGIRRARRSSGRRDRGPVAPGGRGLSRAARGPRRVRPRGRGNDLVFRLERFLQRVGYRDEVVRLYPDPMTRDARWAGVVEILNFAENHVRRRPSRRSTASWRSSRSRAATTPSDEPKPRATPSR
jgi:DNA helicase-2/ATP-dependent DNA helicase PcrA